MSSASNPYPDAAARDGRQPTLGAAHGLGVARRPRGEEEQQEVLGCDGVEPCRGGADAEQVVTVGVAVHAQDVTGVDPDVEAVEELCPGGVGDDQVAVGEDDVAGELGAAAGGVDPHHGGAGQRGGAEPEEVFGDVVEKHAHMERSRCAQGDGQGGAPAALGHDVAPRPRGGAGVQTGPVVVRPGHEQVGHGARRCPGPVLAWRHARIVGDRATASGRRPGVQFSSWASAPPR